MRSIGSAWVCSAVAAACLLVFLLGCSRPSPDPEAAFRPASDEFSVMTYNLKNFNYRDRNHDGQANNFKPDDEVNAVVSIIARIRPDILAVQELGDPSTLELLRSLLKPAGVTYDHTEFLYSANSNANMGVLSRFPIIDRDPIRDARYSIGDQDVPVARGFINLDIEVNRDYTFRLMVAHLKSKLYHPLGQTEMRRNEARLLNKHVRRALEVLPNLNVLVVGDFNDNIQSAALREALGKEQQHLFDLRPRDYLGDVWSHFWSEQELYERIDYMLVSSGMMREVVSNKTFAVRDPLTYKASDHRPLVAVFKAADR